VNRGWGIRVERKEKGMGNDGTSLSKGENQFLWRITQQLRQKSQADITKIDRKGGSENAKKVLSGGCVC